MQKKREIFGFVSFLVEHILYKQRITEKKIKDFNFFKKHIKIVSVTYCRGNIIRNRIKRIDKNTLLIRIKKTRYVYYKIVIEVNDLDNRTIEFLNSFLVFLN